MSITALLYEVLQVETKYRRGKEILLNYIKNHGTGKYPDDYVDMIIEAISNTGYDIPIPVWRMCQALEVAEKRNKMIFVQPAPEFLSGGSNSGQCDGWRYVIKYVDKPNLNF